MNLLPDLVRKDCLCLGTEENENLGKTPVWGFRLFGNSVGEWTSVWRVSLVPFVL